MNVLAMPTESAVARMVNGNRSGWWNDKGLIKLARRTAFRDTNDDEFDQAVAFCREKNLSPMSGQLFAFVFNKDDAKRRNMVIVTSIMGYRAIANRSGDYMPGPTKALFEERAKNDLTNPRGLIRATAGADRFIRGGWKSVEEEALWESFAPLIKSGADEDAYELVDTGEVWPDSGKPKKRRKLKSGAEIVEMLDPKKDGWRKMPDVMLKKCAEATALRRGWPEDLSGLYVEEELHRSQVIDADYTDLTPSEIVARINTEDRIERIGGPSLYAVFDDSGTLESVPMGKFFDRVDAHTKGLEPAAVRLFIDRNKVGLQAFWAHSKNDALELKKILETRSGAVASNSPPASDEGTRAKAAPSQHGETNMGGAASPATKTVRAPISGALPKLTGAIAERHRDNLIRQIGQLETPGDLLGWARDGDSEIARLPDAMAELVRGEFNSRSNTIKGMQRQ
jgi:phage recombination protein Bet